MIFTTREKGIEKKRIRDGTAQSYQRNLNPVRNGGHVSAAKLTPSTGWSDTVKTSHAKELPPQSQDW